MANVENPRGEENLHLCKQLFTCFIFLVRFDKLLAYRRSESTKMPWKSHYTTDIPQTDLASYVFGSPTKPLPDTPILLDAAHPNDYWLSHQTYRLWCKRIAAGLRKNGLQPGDRVLLFSGNTLFFPCVFMGVIMAGGVFTGVRCSPEMNDIEQCR